jgi:hypothetical protein
LKNEFDRTFGDTDPRSVMLAGLRAEMSPAVSGMARDVMERYGLIGLAV